MASRTILPGKTKRPLNIKDPEKRSVDPELVAKALGAEVVEGVRLDEGGSPVSAYALKQVILSRLPLIGRK